MVTGDVIKLNAGLAMNAFFQSSFQVQNFKGDIDEDRISDTTLKARKETENNE